MKPAPSQERRLISAAAMAAAVARDPNLQAPSHPKFADGLVVVRLADGLLVEGTAERQVFRGRAATALLPRLFPLLDGTRTTEELAAALPDVPPEAIHNAVALLYMRGLLYEGAEPANHLVVPLAAFLGRHVDTTRVNRSLAGAGARLSSFRVGIFGPADCAALLAAELEATGVRGKVLEPSVANFAGLDLIVALARGGDSRSWADLDQICKAQGVPWLRSVCAGSAVELGPRFAPPTTCCYACFSVAREGTSDGANAPDGTHAPALERAWVALLATEIVFHASRICPPLTTRDAVHLDLHDWTQLRGRPPKRPGCAVCGQADKKPPRDAEIAYRYEQSVEFPPKELMNPKDHQTHYRLANLELQYEQKRFPTAGLFPLLRDEGPSVGPLDLARLSVLLLRTAGLRSPRAQDEKLQRWAPTGGNLGSVQVYLLANEIPGLEPGCYFYEADAHGLARLAPERTRHELASLTREATGVDGAAVLVLTAAYSRVSFKYGAFAYRTVHLDAGVAVAQLAAVAANCGLRYRVAAHWDGERLARELALGEGEPITVVIGLSPGSA
jgi:SagB-type dehydrogenase family enzyme